MNALLREEVEKLLRIKLGEAPCLSSVIDALCDNGALREQYALQVVVFEEFFRELKKCKGERSARDIEMDLALKYDIHYKTVQNIRLRMMTRK